MIAAEPLIMEFKNLIQVPFFVHAYCCTLDIMKDGCQPEEINNFFASAGGVAAVEAEGEMDEEAKLAEPQAA